MEEAPQGHLWRGTWDGAVLGTLPLYALSPLGEAHGGNTEPPRTWESVCRLGGSLGCARL